MNNQDTLSMIFGDSDFVVLESGIRVMNEYINNMEGDMKEKYKRIVMIKELAKKKLKTTILDEVNISALLKEIAEIINKRSVINRPNAAEVPIKSFKNLMMDDCVGVDYELARDNYIYNNSVIYVDSIRDLKEVTNSIFRSLKINEESSQGSNSEMGILSNAVEKAKVFKNHFELVKYFIMNNAEYKNKFQKNAEGMEISTLDCLQGTNTDMIILGILVLNEEGTIQMQDNTKVIDLDISECDWGKGYFTNGCIVLCQGNFKNDVLKAKAIVHPPPAFNNATFEDKFDNDFFGAITKGFKSIKEEKKQNLENQNHHSSNLGNNNCTVNSRPEETFLMQFLNKDLSQSKYFFPKTFESSIQINLDTLKQSGYNASIMERVSQSSFQMLSEEFFIVISNPDLSNPHVLTAIDKIITGYNQNSESLPFMIILTGSFTSDTSFDSFKNYNQVFESLANIIAKNTNIVKNSYIVVIPGPEDFSISSAFPRPPLIASVVNILKKKVPNLIAATNPCRLSIFGKEVVIFRDNLNKKLARNSIVKCEDIEKNKDFYIHTILAQGHLAPFDLGVTPQIWHLNLAMTMLPLPDILILADVVEDFYMTNKISTVVNPGNFSKDFSFNIIFPLKNLVEPCKITI